MYAAGDPAGALPPFNLSCQVRRWRSYICAELAAEVRLDRWGAAAPRSRSTKALLGLPCRLFFFFFPDLLTRFARLSFVLRVFRVLKDAFYRGVPAKPTRVPFFITATNKAAALPPCFRTNCRLVSSWSSFKCSQAHRCPPAIKRAWCCLQASGARPACLSGTLHF